MKVMLCQLGGGVCMRHTSGFKVQHLDIEPVDKDEDQESLRSIFINLKNQIRDFFNKKTSPAKKLNTIV